MKKSFYVVALGASAGGQKALEEFFRNLPARPNAAFIVVTHLSRDYTSRLDHILSRFSRLPVSRIKHNERLEINHIHVMPENVTLTISDGIFRLTPRAEDETVNRAIDIFFEALAADQKDRAIAIVLSGAGSDGAWGVQRIHEAGGKVFVQDPASTSFRAMPLAAIRADHPDFITSPSDLAKRLMKSLAESDMAMTKIKDSAKPER